MSLSDKHKKRLKLLFIKLPIFIGLLCLVMIGALKLVERYPEPLKEGFEKYLSEKTNTNTTVERLEKAAFYPDIDIRLHNMTMHRVSNAAIVDMEAEKFYISVPLSGLFTQSGKVNLLDVENLRASEKIFTPHSFHLEKAEIINRQGPEKYGSFIVANGLYGDQKMNFEAEIKKKDDAYIVPDNVSFSVKLGPYQFNGTTEKKLTDVLIKDAIFQKGLNKSSPNNYVLVKKGKYTQDNPLACLYLYAGSDLKQCDQYLK